MQKIWRVTVAWFVVNSWLMAGEIMSPVAFSPENDWNGFFFGVEGGLLKTTNTVEVTSNYGFKDHYHLKPNGSSVGFYTGYNWVFSKDWLIGIEAEYLKDFSAVDEVKTLDSHYHYRLEYQWQVALLAKIGKVFNNTYFPYVIGGWTWHRIKGNWPNTVNDFYWTLSDKTTVNGCTVGIGLEIKLSHHIHARLQYRYNRYKSKRMLHSDGTYATYENSHQHDHMMTLGVSYQF